MIYEIREIGEKELSAALDLTWEVFCQYEGAVKGVAAFRRYLNYESFLRQIKMGRRILWGCYGEGALLGVLCFNVPNHIALLYVLSAFHHRGVGSALYRQAEDCGKANYAAFLTVNASRQGVGFYEKLGFWATGGEQWVNGIPFTPMKVDLEIK